MKLLWKVELVVDDGGHRGWWLLMGHSMLNSSNLNYFFSKFNESLQIWYKMHSSSINNPSLKEFHNCNSIKRKNFQVFKIDSSKLHWNQSLYFKKKREKPFVHLLHFLYSQKHFRNKTENWIKKQKKNWNSIKFLSFSFCIFQIFLCLDFWCIIL